MNELKWGSGNLHRLQLDAVAYLWEMCYNLLLDKKTNVSIGPGFDAMGPRLNKKKRKRDKE